MNPTHETVIPTINPTQYTLPPTLDSEESCYGKSYKPNTTWNDISGHGMTKINDRYDFTHISECFQKCNNTIMLLFILNLAFTTFQIVIFI